MNSPTPTTPTPTTGGGSLHAGAATTDITPNCSVFLFGYPHVPRNSTGTHDPLECSALYLKNEYSALLFLSTDLIFVSKRTATEARRRISAATGVPEWAIAITATHTHSGPVTLDYASNAADPVVPKTDAVYVEWLTEKLVETARAAVAAAEPAEAGLALAKASGVGSNRHDPAGPVDSDVPVLVARSLKSGAPIGCMLAYAMHPTVLHEDSTLVSADFPHFTRAFLRERGLVPAGCPILYHSGASGDQSPRHVTRENTFAEARRLGELLGAEIASVIPGIKYARELALEARSAHIDFEVRKMPPVETAAANARAAAERFASLKAAGAPRTQVRTAECDMFGAEETVALARAAADGRLAGAAAGCSPVEAQVFFVGPWKFVFWPGEFFVDYALQIKQRYADTFVITFANGDLQGYIVTPEAAEKNVYEATNALFAPENGQRMVDATLALLK